MNRINESTANTTSQAVDKNKVLFADLCFEINGVCFHVQNQLGRFSKEKQYADSVEMRLKENNIPYVRELIVGKTGNRVDFIVDGKALVELKAKPFLTQDDFFQVQRYLHILDLELGLIVNFWSRSALPKRVLRKSVNS